MYIYFLGIHTYVKTIYILKFTIFVYRCVYGVPYFYYRQSRNTITVMTFLNFMSLIRGRYFLRIRYSRDRGQAVDYKIPYGIKKEAESSRLARWKGKEQIHSWLESYVPALLQLLIRYIESIWTLSSIKVYCILCRT